MIVSPGATRSGFFLPPGAGPRLENQVIRSSACVSVRRSSTAPTVIAEGLIPGDSIVLRPGPLFPAAITTLSPALIAFSTAWQSGSSEQGRFTLPPNDIERIRRLSLLRFAIHHSIPLMIVESYPSPFLSSTLTPTIPASGAGLLYFPLLIHPLPAASPAI